MDGGGCDCGGSSNRIGSRDESVEGRDESVECECDSIEPGENTVIMLLYRRLGAGLRYLRCWCNGDNAAPHLISHT